MTVLTLDGDLVVGRAIGAGVVGVPLPDNMTTVPLDRLRWNGSAIVDAAGITAWYIDPDGTKRLAAAVGRQALTCAWDAVLIKDGSTWRAQTNVDALKARAAQRRWEKEVGGVEIDGINVGVVPTDDRAKMLIMGAAGGLGDAEEAPFVVNNASVTLNGLQFRALLAGIVAHVQSCFATQADVLAAITAGSITTIEQVDAAFE